jgi:hypothetical protein
MLLAVLLGSLLSPVQFVQGAEAAGTVMKSAGQARADGVVHGTEALPARRANPVDSPQKWTWVTVADHLNGNPPTKASHSEVEFSHGEVL